MKPITDRDCLRDARRALAEHLATRPATPSEARDIAERHRARESTLLAQAAELRALRCPTAAEIGHGPGAPREQHIAAVAVALAGNDAAHLEALAVRPRMAADAWERIADRPDLAYATTTAELQARVDYYRKRVKALVPA
jgi:hypothetical protein